MKIKKKVSLVLLLISLSQGIFADDLEDFRAELIKILADCGVAVVLLPTLFEEMIRGATFLDGNKVVMGLKLCSDKKEFLECLFHELAHIIYGHIEKENGISEEDENLADEFAKQMM